MAQLDFAQVYAEHKEMVWQLVSRYVFSREDREDLFQEAFLNIHKALPGFRGEAAVATWLYRITANTAVNYLKKRQRHQFIVNLLGSLRIIESEEPEPADTAALERPLGKLNPRQRLVLIMADVEERKLEEISKLLAVPLGTVKSTLHRARELVRKELMKDGRL